MSQTIQLLCSTGTFSRNPDYANYQAILKYGPILRADGFEVMIKVKLPVANNLLSIVY